ncbi:helix-turn-helix domain-containing protein [Roseibaca sp. V10]|uniref:Helix-turn-helix domain-containing protein n=1 Tax=Roseinatronobacter domitianus TaxID=2940293 RepID=A0ABT0M5J5_9RHOB|nr:helix-turn-helix domain-containing protein [Roseibaca domitiana]MCL1630136.1 helix-turn-helix domain-containing protein [Roseibaca domitiana]
MTEHPVYLTQRDLAARFRLSVRTIERWRADDYGPAWITIGRSIRYSVSDVLAWEAGQRSARSPGASEIDAKTPQ